MSDSSVTPCTVAPHVQAPVSVGFPRQEYESGLPFPFPGDLPNKGWNPCLLHCRWILDHWATWEALNILLLFGNIIVPFLFFFKNLCLSSFVLHLFCLRFINFISLFKELAVSFDFPFYYVFILWFVKFLLFFSLPGKL